MSANDDAGRDLEAARAASEAAKDAVRNLLVARLLAEEAIAFDLIGPQKTGLGPHEIVSIWVGILIVRAEKLATHLTGVDGAFELFQRQADALADRKSVELTRNPDA
jgi:hypothetical protein